MDHLDFFSRYVMTGLEMLMGFWFFAGFLQKRANLFYGILFGILGMTILEVFSFRGPYALLIFILLLVTAGELLYRADFRFAGRMDSPAHEPGGRVCRDGWRMPRGLLASMALYAVVTVEIMNLCSGLSNSITYLLFPLVFEKSPRFFGFLLMGAGSVLSLALSALCYRGIQKCCGRGEALDRKYVFVILLPVLLIFWTSEMVNETIYGNVTTTEKERMLSGADACGILGVQILGIVSLFCILFSCKKLAEGFRRNKEAELLKLQAHSLQQYVEEAKLRYEKTKSFRHDIKNHITVVKELLQNQRPEAALQYIEGMENLAADISFPVSTGHPVLDILLGNKLGIAEENGIEVRCSLAVPDPCQITDIDFCIMLGNALDNAISACNRVDSGKQKFIHIEGKVQGDFLLIEIENSYSGSSRIRSGTGLANIRAAAEKYHGVMEIRTEGEKFLLSILVILPQQPGSISQQTGEGEPEECRIK